MHTIKIAGKQYKAPSKWDELNEKQLIAYAAVSLKKMSIRSAAGLLVKVMYQIPLEVFFLLKSFQVAQISSTLSFFFEGNKLVKWIIPSFILPQPWYLFFKRVRVYGPGTALENITIKEFRLLEIYYQAYVLSGKVMYLEQLIATLYRKAAKKDIDHDIRESVAELTINKRAANMARLPAKMKHAILLNYEGCRVYIIKKYPKVFKKSKVQSSAKKDIYDYNHMIQGVAGGKFGAYKETQETLINPFFEHLNKQIEEYEKNKP